MSLVVLALAAFGAVVTLAKRRHPAVVFLIVATLAFAAVPIMLFGDPRYRVPAEPLFAVFAAAALGAAIESSHRWRVERTPNFPEPSLHTVHTSTSMSSGQTPNARATPTTVSRNDLP